jgi:hypothetical protein
MSLVIFIELVSPWRAAKSRKLLAQKFVFFSFVEMDCDKILLLERVCWVMSWVVSIGLVSHWRAVKSRKLLAQKFIFFFFGGGGGENGVGAV